MKKNYGLTEQEVEQGYVLTCQAVPTSDEVVLNYDA
jgi:ring-1,2-phenylacetyl-CoA epoxidase subunit PaaE